VARAAASVAPASRAVIFIRAPRGNRSKARMLVLGAAPWPPGKSGPQARSSVASQPMPAAIQRRASAWPQAAGSSGSQRLGWASTPQWYRPSASLQASAAQAPCRRRDSSMPSGQGSAAQQVPQPLQGSPAGGCDGAAGCSRITRWFATTAVCPSGAGIVRKPEGLGALNSAPGQAGCGVRVAPWKSNGPSRPLAGLNEQQGGSQSANRCSRGRGRLINPSELWKPGRKVSER
jgi:hypothetical protein